MTTTTAGANGSSFGVEEKGVGTILKNEVLESENLASLQAINGPSSEC